MLRHCVFASCVLAGCGLFAQNIALSGKISDSQGNAIGGAIVTLKSNQLADTTDASDIYNITGQLTSIKGLALSGVHKLEIRNGLLSMFLAESQELELDIYDYRGNLLKSFKREKSQSGRLQFNIQDLKIASNMMLMHLQIGESNIQLSYNPVLNRFYNGNSSLANSEKIAGLGKQAAADELEATALGYASKSVTIDSYEGTHDFNLEAEFTGSCTESQRVNTNVSGSGPHDVVVETNSDDDIDEGTIFRPADMGPGKNYPIFMWGEGGCSLDGLSNSAAMAEIASHGYFVIADGTPNNSGSGRPMNANDLDEMGRPMIAYLDWAIAENSKPCSEYYNSLDVTKTASNGFSCGGLLAMGTAKDPRITTWGLTSSGSFNNNPTLWNAVHTPVLILEGHQDNTGAYDNGLRDYDGIRALGHPVYFISNKNQGHGGDLWERNGGDFAKINLVWLNWWLKGDESETGKGALIGSSCSYCSDNNWEIRSENIP